MAVEYLRVSYSAPFSTDKEGDENAIEKGVGLTFVIFTCNHFTITNETDTSIRSSILDAYNGKQYVLRYSCFT